MDNLISLSPLAVILFLLKVCSNSVEALYWLPFRQGKSSEDNRRHLSSESTPFPTFDQELIDLLKVTDDLSRKVYQKNPTGGADYDEFYFFAEPLDHAIVARRQGKCFASFRGTVNLKGDAWQNLQPGRIRLCANPAMTVEESTDWTDALTRDCCTVRIGYYKAYNETYRNDFELALRNCAASCSDPNHCVYLSGLSQGAAIAGVAAIVLYDLNPWVIGWEPPKAVYDPPSRVITGRNCPLMNSERWLTFLNSAVKPVGSSQIPMLWYDFIPQIWQYGAEAYGHLLLMGEDVSGMVYLGLDYRDTFQPFDIGIADTHTTSFKTFNNIVSYYENNSSVSLPIRLSGYIQGIPCTKDKECQSQQCKRRSAADSLKRCA